MTGAEKSARRDPDAAPSALAIVEIDEARFWRMRVIGKRPPNIEHA